MIATLPMYDPPRLNGANDRFWALIRDGLRARGIPAPDALARGGDDLMALWSDPGLVLGQTCGLPFRTRLAGRVQIVGTPDYGVEGAPPGQYRSLLVVRADDPRPDFASFGGARLAYNDTGSQSGWAAALTHAARAGIALSPSLRTGAHAESLRAVAEGRAEIAAIDAVTHAIQAAQGGTAGTRVLEATDPTPGLPLICAPGIDAGAVFAAVEAAIPALSAQDRADLHLKGLCRIPEDAYLAVPTPLPA